MILKAKSKDEIIESVKNDPAKKDHIMRICVSRRYISLMKDLIREGYEISTDLSISYRNLTTSQYHMGSSISIPRFMNPANSATIISFALSEKDFELMNLVKNKLPRKEFILSYNLACDIIVVDDALYNRHNYTLMDYEQVNQIQNKINDARK